MERIDHADRGGVMIGAFGSRPVVSDHGHVEIPARDLGFSVLHGFDGSGAEGDGRKSGGRRDAFLSATIHSVDLPIINANVRSS